MMKLRFKLPLLSLLAVASVFQSCKTQEMLSEDVQIVLDTVQVTPEKEKVYRAARTRYVDILHTKLNLSFNWDSAFVQGEAEITLTPFFYSLDSVLLDARGFRLHEVREIKPNGKEGLKYEYDSEDIRIALGREIHRNDTLKLFIKYTAMPDKIKVKGSAAITSDKGLYFVNKDGKDPDKPRQLWTQGETESNSCWFPTFDSPNEKFTHEIYVKIEEGQTSISNGLKMFSLDNGDGTKTEYWKMDKPNAAYLVMLAVGPFAEYEDSWGEMQVNYYLDSAFLPYAEAIFGNTPEMLEFYSNYLGVPYPWQKYDQVVVHDYVSGAMENTTATIHGSFLHRTHRQLYDHNNEDVIAHELFHHWFGDLVTCESWSNLTLNEGFATYGEYLWTEHYQGRDEADEEFTHTRFSYIMEADRSKKDLIRFYYDDKEDMFDGHSYSKGGLILHMLRHYMGDEAFRASLKHYLNKHAYQTVEVHDLRIAMEEVTGLDWNWFFNQWFLGAGHPKIKLTQNYDATSGDLTLYFEQTQNLEESTVFRLPMTVQYKIGDDVLERFILVDKALDTVVIKTGGQPEYVNLNPGSTVLMEADFEQSKDAWITQYKHAPLGNDKSLALESLSEMTDPADMPFYMEVLTHDYWYIRRFALDFFTTEYERTKADSLVDLVYEIAYKDDSYIMRYLAIDFLTEQEDGERLAKLGRHGLKDTSIYIESASIEALIKAVPEEAGKMIRAKKDFQYDMVAASCFVFYAEHGLASDHDAVIKIMNNVHGWSKFQIISEYKSYLERLKEDQLFKAFPTMSNFATNEDEPWIRQGAIQLVIYIHERLYSKELKQSEKLQEYVDAGMPGNWQGDYSAELVAFAHADETIKEVQNKETRGYLVSMIRDYLERIEKDGSDE